ncbi:hypothetical protein [Cognatilysobacter terrigena]|uniref:hypothetical protein n=1 Tax=Cognatilysobacter terrigena TaxID=2488749 RepID=UPI00106104E7|nr:hypothetical protein [Lysobacter terrigena]
MSSVSTRIAISRVRARLSFATKLLGVAALVQLALFLPRGWLPDNRLFALVCIASAVFGIAGFRVAYRALDLDEEMDDARSSLRRFGWRVSGSVQMMFCLAFLVPLLNLVILLWTWLRIRAGRAALDGIERSTQEMDARRRRVMGG